MKWIVAAVVLFSAAGVWATEDGTWEPLGTKEGITLFRKEVPGSPVIAFKGDGVIDAPLVKVASIILDEDRSPEWMDSLLDSKVVRLVNPNEFIEFDHIGMPPLVTDREFVTDVKLTVDEAAHSFTVEYKSVDDPATPPGKRIRGDMIYSVFVLTSIEHGQKTQVRAELHADPKGWLPKFLVNFFQKDWPHDTFAGVRKQAAKSDIKQPAMFTDVLGRVDRITNW